jgi:hypothetical protein
VIVFLAVAVVGSAVSFVPLSRLLDGGELDLPCPWCHAQTAEDDEACPACGRSFTSR